MRAVTIRTSMASTARVFLLRLCLAVAIVLVFTVIMRLGVRNAPRGPATSIRP